MSSKTSLPDVMTRRQPLDPALRALVTTVRAMRDAQKRFFRTQGEEHQQALADSRRLERAVDIMLAKFPNRDCVGDLFAEQEQQP